MSHKSSGGGLLSAFLSEDSDASANLIRKRLQAGSSATSAILTLFDDVARAQQTCAVALRDAAVKSHQELKSRKAADDGASTFLSLWAELNEFVMATAKLQDQLATSITSKVIQPLQQTASNYERTRQDLCGDSSPPQPTDGPPKNRDKAQRRAQAKVQLATEELRTSLLSKDEIVTRFGTDLNPDLLKKANERISRANALKTQAEAELRECKSSTSSPQDGQKASVKMRIDASSLNAIETCEETRTVGYRDCIRDFTRVHFALISNSGKCFTSLSRAVDAYSPSFDIFSWVVRSTGTSLSAPATRDNLAALTEQETNWLSGQTAANASDVEALHSMKNLIKMKDTKIKSLNEEILLLKDEIAVLSTQDFHPGGLNQIRNEESKQDSNGSSPAEQSSQMISLPAIESRKSSSPERLTLFKRMATAIKPKQKSTDLQPPTSLSIGSQQVDDTSYNNDPHQEQTEEQNSQEDSQNDDADFKLSDYVPPLLGRLNVLFPPGTKTSDKFLEIERRFEEYLWALRNLQLADLARVQCWDHESYCRGLATEYGYQAYLHKLPNNCALTRFTDVSIPRALEWGCEQVSSTDWRLIAYETLLLVYYTMSQALISRETARLPRQDIHELNVNEITSQAAAKNAKVPDGARHRRYSLVNPLDAVAAAENAEGDRAMMGKQDDPVQTQAAVMLESNATLIRGLIRQWRLKIGLSSKDNSIVTALLLPFGLESGEEGAALGFATLDVRYRLSRLHNSWVLAGKDLNYGVKSIATQPTAKSWITRQLHFIRTNVLMKTNRLVKFLPQLRGVHSWLTEWPVRDDWHSFIAKRLPAPTNEDDRFLRDHLHQLVDCLKLSLVILSDFWQAHMSDRWGCDLYQNEPSEVMLIAYDPSSFGPSSRGESSTENTEPTDGEIGFGYRNAEGFLKLVALMTCISGIDKTIRHIIAEDEKALLAGSRFPHVGTESESADVDDDFDNNPQDATRTIHNDSEWKHKDTFDLFAVLDVNAVDVYWQYELPIQHLIISELVTLVGDDTTASKLAVDGVNRMHTTMIAAHIIQHGFDPTVSPGTIKIPFVTISLETFALYIIKALWEQVVSSFMKKGTVKDEFAIDLEADDDGCLAHLDEIQTTTVPMNMMITREVIAIMNQIAADYVSWLITNSTPSADQRKGSVDANATDATNAGVSETSYGAGTRVLTSGGDLRPANGTGEVSISETRMARILACTPHNMFDSLSRARGDYREGRNRPEKSPVPGTVPEPTLGSTRKYTDATDPDFAVLDYDKLDEVADLPNFFQQIDCIREEPEGVSLLLPSRLERVISEISLRRMITDPLRNQLFQALCDYRHHFEAETLPSAIQLWDRVSDLLVLTPAKVAPQAPDMNQLNVLAPLPTVLSGPIAQYDLYRHFIVQSVRATFDCLFDEAITSLHHPSEEDAWFLSRLLDFEEEPEIEKNKIEKAWSKVIKRFADGATQFLVELRAELIYYTSPFTHFLPGNQHALIVMHTAEDRLRMMISELRNSPFWPDEDLPPNSAPIVAALAHFDNLVREVRTGTRYDLLLADSEPLATPLAPCVATALNRKLQSMEGMLDRCLKAEVWKPVDPPETLYSVSAVDFLQFIHHVLGVVWDFHTSPDWILPILIQFICRVSKQFADFTKQSVMDIKLIKLSKRCNELIQHLVSPLPRVDVSLLGQLIGGGKDRKKKGWKGLVGLGGRKHRGKDLAHQLAALQKQQADMSSPMGNSDSHPKSTGNSGDEKDGVFSNEDASGGEDSDSLGGSDEEGQASQVGQQRSRKKKKWKTKLPAALKGGGDDEEAAEVTEELKELASRIGPVMAVQLMNVSTSLGKTSLPTWLTRLHNLQYFTVQLPAVAQKIISVAVEQATTDDPRHGEILKALERAGGRKANSTDKHANNLDEASRSKFVAWGAQLQEAVDQCKIVVHTRATEICRLTALRIAYHEFCCDVFEEMYVPDFQRGQTLSGVVMSLNQTVLKFTQSAPAEYQNDLLSYVVQELGKAWAVMLTELGYAGHTFSGEDLAVMDSDLESLRSFASMHSLSEEISLGSAGSDRTAGGIFSKFKREESDRKGEDTTPAQKINLFDYLSEFLVFLGTQPLLLAQLGGNYNPEKKKQTPAPSPNPTNNPEQSPKEDVPNVFADLGQAAPAFEAKDILGAKKKKKGVFGGMWKAVGLK